MFANFLEFKSQQMKKPTDWDNYYKNPAALAHLTRRFTLTKIINTLRPHILDKTITICEVGGANSCIATTVCNDFDVLNYHILDTNKYGLSLLEDLSVSTELTSDCFNILERPTEISKKFDMVISVGLIEHFSPEDTRLAITHHFELCKEGGLVLLTFPTPTVLYRLIRFVSEKLGIWDFPDERPLEFEEVLTVARRHGEVLHTSINWMIGLTQGFVLVKTKSNNT